MDVRERCLAARKEAEQVRRSQDKGAAGFFSRPRTWRRIGRASAGERGGYVPGPGALGADGSAARRADDLGRENGTALVLEHE